MTRFMGLLFIKVMIFGAILGSNISSAGAATAGLLDPTYSNDGVMSQSVYTQAQNITERATAMTTDADDKVLVIGRNNREYLGYWGSSFVARFTTSGALDTSFGTGGTVQFPYGYMLSDVKVDSTGRIVISGYEFSETDDDCWNFQTLLIRLNSAGEMDLTFGSAGKVNYHLTECEYYIPETTSGSALLLDVEDNIITNSVITSDSGFESVLVKFMSNGAIDENYGVGGLSQTGLSHGIWDDLNIQLAFGANRTLLATSTDGDFGEQGTLNVKRFHTNGVIDTTFGQNGETTVEVQDYDANLDAMVVTSEGHIVLLEHEGFAHDSVYLYRFESDGSVDNDFGSSGKVKVEVPAALGTNVAVMEAEAVLASDDSIWLSFYGDYFSKKITKMAVTKLDKDGVVESAFGSDGTLVITKEGHTSSARRLTLDDSDMAYVAGYLTSDSAGTTDLLVAKVKADGSLDQSYGDQGLVITNISGDDVSASSDSLDVTVFLKNGNLMHIGTMWRTVDNTVEAKLLITMSNDSGVLLNDFSDDGIALLDLSHKPDTVKAKMDDQDRVIVVAAGEKSVTTLRLLSDGTLDATFGSNGTLVTNFDNEVLVQAVEILSDGQNQRIVAVIEQDNGLGLLDNTVKAQLLGVTTQGALDSGFGQSGKVALDSFENYGLFSQSDGNFSVVGSDYQHIITEHFTFAGAVNESLVSSGVVKVAPESHKMLSENITWALEASAQDHNDNIWIALSTYTSEGIGTNKLLRLNRAGHLDPRLLKDIGETDDDLVSETIQRINVDLDGQLVVTQHWGIRQVNFDGFYGANVMRLTSDGEFDTSFGISDAASITFDSHTYDTVIDASGRIYLAGSRPDGDLLSSGNSSLLSLSNFAVVRLRSDTPALNAPHGRSLWVNEDQVRSISSNDLGLASNVTSVSLTTIVSAGVLFNDLNGNSQVDGAGELLSRNGSISKSDIDAGQFKFVSIGDQSAHFGFTTGDNGDSQTVVLPVNPKPNTKLYTPTQSAMTAVNPVVEIDFGELVEGFEQSDVEVSGGTIQGMTFDGYQYLLTIVPSDTLVDGGKISVSIPAGAAKDLSGADSEAASAEFDWTSYLAVDISAPSLAQTGIEAVSFDVTFTGVTDFELTKEEVVLHTEGDVTGLITITDGNTLTPKVTVDGISGNGSFYIFIEQGAGVASDGRKTQSRQSDTVEVVNIAPTVDITLTTADKTIHGPSTYMLNFNNAASVNLTASMVEVVSDDGVTATVEVNGGNTTMPEVILKDFRGTGFVGISIPSGVATSSSNIASAAASAPYSLKLQPNNAPSISGNPSTTVKGGVAYSFNPVANDVDGNEGLVFSIANQPSWASFDEQTGSLSGTPSNANVATYSGIVISVTDPRGEGASLTAFNIEVTQGDGGSDGGGDGGSDGGGNDGGSSDGSGNQNYTDPMVPIYLLLMEEDNKKKAKKKSTKEVDVDPK